MPATSGCAPSYAPAAAADGMRVDSPGVIEGHNPMLRGRQLSAFVAGGIDSDHTLSTPEDLLEKARQGVVLMLQERYLSREAIAALEALPFDIGLCLVTDDVAPDYLLERGHLDQVLRRTIELGMDPMRALRAVTFNPARRMRLWDRGLIAPGRAADIVLVDNLIDFRAHTVLVDGKVVAQDGRSLWSAPAGDGMHALTDTVPLPPQTPADFTVHGPTGAARAEIHLIDCVPGQTLVRKSTITLDLVDGVPQLAEDMAFICVVNRYANAGERSFGVIRGLGIHHGAYATTYAHDGHNLCVVGRTPEEMAHAANAVIAAHGGIAVTGGDGQTVVMPLPIAGILSALPVHAAAEQTRAVGHALRAIGIDHPYWLMRISTFTLPVSSGLRITDVGLVDAQARVIVPLFL